MEHLQVPNYNVWCLVLCELESDAFPNWVLLLFHWPPTGWVKPTAINIHTVPYGLLLFDLSHLWSYTTRLLCKTNCSTYNIAFHVVDNINKCNSGWFSDFCMFVSSFYLIFYAFHLHTVGRSKVLTFITFFPGQLQSISQVLPLHSVCSSLHGSGWAYSTMSTSVSPGKKWLWSLDEPVWFPVAGKSGMQ